MVVEGIFIYLLYLLSTVFVKVLVKKIGKWHKKIRSSITSLNRYGPVVQADRTLVYETKG